MIIDSKSNVVLLLLDLSAAFDTIKHNLLLTKLKNVYGITKLALSWLQCNLNNCTFKVKVKKATFSECCLDIGVPQALKDPFQDHYCEHIVYQRF